MNEYVEDVGEIIQCMHENESHSAQSTVRLCVNFEGFLHVDRSVPFLHILLLPSDLF